MSSLVSLPPFADANPIADGVIENSGFFPDIDAAAVRLEQRIVPAVTAARLRAAILAAMLTVGRDTEAFVADCEARGYATLAAVPAPTLGGESRLVLLYQRAVSLFARAELLDRQRDFDTTAAGDGLADTLSPSIAELRRDAQHAIRDLVGRGRTTVDLI